MLLERDVERKAPQVTSGASRRVAQIAVRRARQTGCHALVVENEAGTRSLCRRILEGYGCTVEAVSSGVEALALARQRRPDVVIMALQLNDAHGLQVMDWMQANPALKSVPVVIMGAATEDFSSLQASGARAVLRKPVSPAAIDEVIKRCFQDSKPAKSVGS
ncbi:MAG: response regulator [Rhodospirillales bacterium]